MDSHTTSSLGLGALFGAGLYTAVVALADARRTPGPDPDGPPPPAADGGYGTGAGRGWRARGGERPVRRVALTSVVAVGAFAFTGWPVALPIGAVAAWFLPALLGPDHVGRQRIERLEAIAGWTEQLRDTMAAASGLEQSLQATAIYAPAPLRAPVTALAARLDEGVPLVPALHALAGELDDPLADKVVIALVNASERQTGRLGDLLAALAVTAREQARMQIRAAAARAQVRTSVRMITATAVGMVLALIALDPSYLSPYNTAVGQLVLLAVAGLFALAFTQLARLAAFHPGDRLLGTTETPSTTGGGASNTAADSGMVGGGW